MTISSESEVLRACPLCGSTDLRRWRSGYDRSHLRSPQRFPYARCRSCGVRFEAVRPTEDQIGGFYPATYYDFRRPEGAAKPDGGLWRRLERFNERMAKRLPDRLPRRLREVYEAPRPGAVLLDYGCGSPTFLNMARERGWTGIGLDVSPLVLEEVISAGHRALPASEDGLAQVEPESVSLVRMNHVVEHLYRPRDALRAVLRSLEPGGVFHAATPNPDSYASAVLRSRWLGLDAPRHVLLYPPEVLSRLLREIGFARVDVDHEVLTKDIARSLGNVLHDLRLLEHADILAMADRKGLAMALEVPARLMAKAGASDRFHCFAVK